MKTNVVFVHGFLGSSLNWGSVISQLRNLLNFDDYNFHAVDLLWHSKNNSSFIPDDGKLIRELSNNLKQKLELLEGPLILVAHSFGLRPLLEWVGTSFEERASLWIVEDSAPALSDHGYRFLNDILFSTPVPFSNRKEAKDYFDSKYSDDKSLSQFLLTNISDLSPGQWTWKFNKEALGELLEEARKTPRWDAWSQFKGKVFLLYGGQSIVLGAETLRRCVESRKGAHLETVLFENSKHWLHFEDRDRFVFEIKRIIENEQLLLNKKS
jgi:pimeloyl-ACP methyl ester carboxylesterase